MRELELRQVPGEVRALEEDGARFFSGYGIVFNQWAPEIMGFREIIRPGSEAGAMVDDLLVAANHDFNFLLGSRAAGTAQFASDDYGVSYRAELNEADPLAVSMYEKVKRGDITGSSFQFSVAEGGDRWVMDGDEVTREITQFAEIIEMGPVARPWYPQTSATAREVVVAIAEARSGHITDETRRVLDRVAIDLSAITEDGASSDVDEAARAGRERTRRRLGLYT